MIVRSPQQYARIGGLLYLLIIGFGLFGEAFVRGTLVVTGNAAATLHNISLSEPLWRLGIIGDLLMHVLDVPVIVILYLLLRPVSRALAQLATLLNIVQTSVLVANKLNLLTPVFLLGDAGNLGNAFPAAQLQALSLLAIESHAHGFAIGLVFFGFACLVRGFLIFKSGYLPRAIGLLLGLAGVSYLTNSLLLLLAPRLASAVFPGVLVPAFVGELSFCLWLIIKGVNSERWKERSATSG